MKPSSLPMFEAAEDTPLFSGTCATVTEQAYTPSAAPADVPLFDMRPTMTPATKRTIEPESNLDLMQLDREDDADSLSSPQPCTQQ